MGRLTVQPKLLDWVLPSWEGTSVGVDYSWTGSKKILEGAHVKSHPRAAVALLGLRDYGSQTGTGLLTALSSNHSFMQAAVGPGIWLRRAALSWGRPRVSRASRRSSTRWSTGKGFV